MADSITILKIAVGLGAGVWNGESGIEVGNMHDMQV